MYDSKHDYQGRLQDNSGLFYSSLNHVYVSIPDQTQEFLQDFWRDVVRR